jgi:hypothetical protein
MLQTAHDSIPIITLNDRTAIPSSASVRFTYSRTVR